MSRQNRITKEYYYVAAAGLSLLFLTVLYGYLLSATVVHVVLQKEIRTEIARVHSEISTLESEYIERQHAVSAELALMQGFVSAPEKIFIDKGETSLVLSNRDSLSN